MDYTNLSAYTLTTAVLIAIINDFNARLEDHEARITTLEP